MGGLLSSVYQDTKDSKIEEGHFVSNVYYHGYGFKTEEALNGITSPDEVRRMINFGFVSGGDREMGGIKSQRVAINTLLDSPGYTTAHWNPNTGSLILSKLSSLQHGSNIAVFPGHLLIEKN